MREWILNDEGALCMSGYPIRIVRGTGEFKSIPFLLTVDPHGPSAFFTLASAKSSAERIADELDEFTPRDVVKVKGGEG